MAIYGVYMYVYGLDLSLRNSGVAIFDEDGNIITFCSIPTQLHLTRGKRLRVIADRLLELKKQYPPSAIIAENSFFGYIKATEAIMQVHGIAHYVFSDVKNFIKYTPLVVKKTIASGTKGTKLDLQKRINETYPELKFEDDDQSDAVAVGLTYFIKTRIIKWEEKAKFIKKVKRKSKTR